MKHSQYPLLCLILVCMIQSSIDLAAKPKKVGDDGQVRYSIVINGPNGPKISGTGVVSKQVFQRFFTREYPFSGEWITPPKTAIAVGAIVFFTANDRGAFVLTIFKWPIDNEAKRHQFLCMGTEDEKRNIIRPLYNTHATSMNKIIAGFQQDMKMGFDAYIESGKK